MPMNILFESFQVFIENPQIPSNITKESVVLPIWYFTPNGR